MSTLLWPGVRTAPALPRPGAHAEVQFPDAKTKTGGSRLFGLTLRKKTTAYVLVTWPGGSTTRTVTGNLRIRMVMQWCVAFNRISDSYAPGKARTQATGPTESGAA